MAFVPQGRNAIFSSACKREKHCIILFEIRQRMISKICFSVGIRDRKYLDILVNDIHSTVIAKIKDNHPVTRVIDMMLYDDNGLYFLTGKGKEFYSQLMEQKYIALSSIKDKRSINLAGKVENIGYEKLDEIFEKSPYMKEI